jgi:hypothetical protein
MTLKEMKTRLTELVGSPSDPTIADLIWALAHDQELRAELDRKVEEEIEVAWKANLNEVIADRWEAGRSRRDQEQPRRLI